METSVAAIDAANNAIEASEDAIADLHASKQNERQAEETIAKVTVIDESETPVPAEPAAEVQESSTAVVEEAPVSAPVIVTEDANTAVSSPVVVTSMTTVKRRASHPTTLPTASADEIGEIVINAMASSARESVGKTDKQANMESAASRATAPTTLPPESA